MATNTLAPQGLIYSRNLSSGSPTYQANIYSIQRAYASNIGIGDLVKTLTGAAQGYVGLATQAEVAVLGVFAGITSSPGAFPGGPGGAVGDGYYDINTGTYQYGLNGAYQSTMLPPVGSDIGAKVISDPFAVFRVQMTGGAWANSLRGRNINFTANTNGAPNAAGQSVLSVDFATIANINTLPFRIIGLSGVQGGPQDPNNTNPWIEVTVNISENLASTGI